MNIKITFILLTILISNLVFARSKFLTQLEKSSYSELTSHSQMMEYLDKIDSLNKIVKISIIGKSVQGRDIPALFFSENKGFGSKRASKPIVMIFCQQHGDEPSGKEAALILTRELCSDKMELLKNLDLILIPMANPDGSEAGVRRNANEVDLNRNHWMLSEPETQALHNIFQEWMPDVTLDVHEYNAVSKSWISNGLMKNVDEMMGGSTNIDIDSDIINYSRNTFIPSVEKLIEQDGFSFNRYVVGDPFEDMLLRYSTTAVNDGRQSFGIFNTLSFIIEGKQYGDNLNLIERRVSGQLSAITAFLKTVGDNRKQILEIVRETRKKLVKSSKNSNSLIHIQMDYYKDIADSDFTFPVFDLYKWREDDKSFDCFRSLVKAQKSVEKPIAYIIPESETEIIELLNRNKIKMKRFVTEKDIELEIYQIRHITEMIEEEMQVPYVDLSTQREKRKIKVGTVIVYLDQSAGNLIPILLEPQSSIGIFSESGIKGNVFNKYLTEGTEYPIYRLIKIPEANINTIDLEISD